MLLLLDVYGLKCATNYILLFIVKSPNIGYIVLLVMNVTMSISIGFYPKLDLWTANKLQLQSVIGYLPNLHVGCLPLISGPQLII
jgi:hypothetical protein